MPEIIYPQIVVRVSAYEIKKFKELKDVHKLSARQVLEYLTCPCDRCKNVDIVAFDKSSGEPFTIPRNLMSKKDNND